MEEARRMLNSQKYNVNEVGLKLGYSTASHFIAAFKKKYGTTPKKYLGSSIFVKKLSMKGVLLVNLGSPDSTETKDVRSYLDQFLMDGRVIDLPKWFKNFFSQGNYLKYPT